MCAQHSDAANAPFFKACVIFSVADRKDADWIYRGLDSFFLDKRSIDAGREEIYAEADPLGWIAYLPLDADAHDLSESERAILDDSEVLVVVCSPAATASSKFDAALKHFQAKRRLPKVLAAIAAWPRAGGGSLFPAALRFQVNPDGSLSDMPREVLAVNISRQARALTLAKIVSGVMDVPFDAIWRREIKARIGRLWWQIPLFVAGTAVLLTVPFLAAIPVARPLVATQTAILVTASDAALAASDVHGAARLALMATYGERLPLYGTNPDIPESRLRAALAANADSRPTSSSIAAAHDASSLEEVEGKALIRLACGTMLADGRGRMSDEELAITRYDRSGPFRDVCRYPLWLVSE